MIFPEQPSTNPASLLPGEAERQGKEVFTTELGGGALANHTSVKVAKDGLDNALRTLGILKGAPKTREEQGLPSAIILDMRAETAYHSVNDFGLYENLFPLGGEIKKGEVLGLVHNMDNPEVPAVPLEPLVPELPSVPLEPFVPLDPLVPLEPSVPDVPLDPGIPEPITVQLVYVPLPT